MVIVCNVYICMLVITPHLKDKGCLDVQFSFELADKFAHHIYHFEIVAPMKGYCTVEITLVFLCVSTCTVFILNSPIFYTYTG